MLRVASNEELESTLKALKAPGTHLFLSLRFLKLGWDFAVDLGQKELHHGN